MVLDELDKVGNDFRGDPANALLEVLGPEPNSPFNDHYVDLPVDLSQVMFLATANLVDPIPPALLDRLEDIEIPGYIEEEKLKIARQFLLPKLAGHHGLPTEKLSINDAAVKRVIREYTREAGLREVERQLARLYRKAARKVVGGRKSKIHITQHNVHKELGPARYYQPAFPLQVMV
jgi:ATP-dependent Lon protease